MPTIRVDGASFDCAPGETVLACLERHDVGVMSSCRTGVCQTCLVRAESGTPPLSAQKGLQDSVVAQGFFLACCALPEEDLTLDLSGTSGREHAARVVSVDRLNERVVRLRCAAESPIAYAAGQFMNIIGPEGAVRSYSLASVASMEPFVEFHVMRMPNGRVSTWIHDALVVDDPIRLLGPQGTCFYTAGAPEQPMLLAGTGTGLAPLYGIVRDALQQGHCGPIHLFHGSVRPDGLYLVEELESLADEHANLNYYRCALESGGDVGGIEIRSIDAYVESRLPDLTGFRVFLCGHPDLVRLMQRAAFLSGANMNDIYVDAFLPAGGGSTAAV